MNELTAALLGMGFQSNRQEILRPAFSYPGNKVDQLKHILPHLPYHDGYCEPFGGSAAVMLNRCASKLEIFNDRYAGVTCFFRVVRDPAKLNIFLKRIAMTLHSREEFGWCKSTWRDCEDEIERAARWYYMIRFAVNGKPNTTFGRSKNAKVTFADKLVKSIPMMHPIHYRMKAVTIENLDWQTCVEDYDSPSMVFYMDPTYLDSDPAYEDNLSEKDHIQLIQRIQHISGFVAVSSYDSPRTNKIYDQPGLWSDKITWERTTTGLTQNFDASNNMQNKETTNNRLRVKEVLWIKANK